jgi:hypothetical protein
MLDWSKYTIVANKLQYKAKYQDKGDLNHTIVLSLADAQTRLDNDGGGQLSNIAMLRIATYQSQVYWRHEYRNSQVVSLDQEHDDGDGNTTELMDTVADDTALDLVAWQDARTWLLGCPKRLIVIAGKRHKGIELNAKDRQYLSRYRQREQRKLFEN